MNDENSAIKAALRALGVVYGRFEYEQHYNKTIVFVNGQPFGTWDILRACFI